MSSMTKTISCSVRTEAISLEFCASYEDRVRCSSSWLVQRKSCTMSECGEKAWREGACTMLQDLLVCANNTVPVGVDMWETAYLPAWEWTLDYREPYHSVLGSQMKHWNLQSEWELDVSAHSWMRCDFAIPFPKNAHPFHRSNSGCSPRTDP